MLRFPWWKILIILLPCIWGIFNVTPHFFYSQVEKYNDVQAQIALDQLSKDELSTADKSFWLEWAPSRLVNLGLDLRGGVHVLVEVSLEEVYSERLQSYWPEIRKTLRQIKESVGTIRQVPGGINELLVKIGKNEGLTEAVEFIRKDNKLSGKLPHISSK